MEPGIYEDLSFEEYLQIDAINNTSMAAALISAKHYHERKPLEQSKPLQVGGLVHCGKLEPLALAQRYAVMPDYHLDELNETDKGKPSQSKNTKFCRDMSGQFRQSNADKEIVPREWYDEMIQIVTAVSKCPEAIVLNAKHIELTLVWLDERSRLMQKARLDAIEPGSHIADLKTTQDILKFQVSIGRYGYHRQAAHYQEGWKVLTGEQLPVWFVPVEKTEPFIVQAAPMDEEALIEGRRQRRTALATIAECRESNVWPGPPSPDKWRLPAWAV